MPADAHKGSRRIYWRGEWVTAELYEMDRVCSGNVIEGPAVIEDPATTFVVPPDSVARLDTHRIFHLRPRTAPHTVAADAEYTTA
jgi:acetone carboxylase beta subunit